MENWASIQLRSRELEIRFEWVDFDGDDAFHEFHVDIVGGVETRRFEFGPCPVTTLRQFSDFFQDRLETASASFHCPDLRVCQLDRTDGGFHLQVRFDAGNQSEDFAIPSPSVTLDDFLSQYDSGTTPHH